jgi:hypothetical protein
VCVSDSLVIGYAAVNMALTAISGSIQQYSAANTIHANPAPNSQITDKNSDGCVEFPPFSLLFVSSVWFFLCLRLCLLSFFGSFERERPANASD